MKAALLMLLAMRLAAQSASVEGNVTDAATGHAIAKAQVTLQGLTPSGNPPDVDVYLAEADSAGHFLLKGVTPGKYEATATNPGYISRLAGGTRARASAVRLTLGAGQRESIALRLMPASVISGRVMNLSGEPVAGAQVQALQEGYEGPGPAEPGTVWWGLPGNGRRSLSMLGVAVTNDRGEYRIFGIPPGRYTLRAASVEAAAYPSESAWKVLSSLPAPVPFGETYYPGALELAGGSELRNVEIRVRQEVPHAIRGLVPSPHTNDFRVNLQRKSSLPGSPYSSSGVNDRTFFFDGVLPGSYLISSIIHDPSHPERVFLARQEVEMVDHDVEDVTLRLVPLKNVSGKVSADGPPGLRFENVNVELFPENPDSPAVTQRVNADGSFLLQALPESYSIATTRTATSYIKWVKMNNEDVPDFRVDLSRMSGPMEIRFGADGGRVAGVVKDASGEPLAEARVTLLPSGAEKNLSQRVRITDTGDDGKFVLPVIAPGDYQIFAWVDTERGAPFNPEFRRKFEDKGTPVHMESNGSVAVELRGIVTR